MMKKSGFGVALALSLTLGGCSCLKDIDQFAAGFTGSSLGHARGVHRARSMAAPAAFARPETALAKCNKSLYIDTGKTPEELKSLEDKCRAVIVNQ